MTDLSIIIVSWNVRDLLRDCLNSISGDIGICISGNSGGCYSTEIIVVDAGSQDGTSEMIRAEYSSVRFIDTGTNVGFSRGNNIGIDAAQGHYVLLLNPDTRVMEGALSTMLSYLDGHPEVGVVGPKLLNADDTTQSSRRRFPTLWTAVFESTWLESIAPRQLLDRYYVNDVDEDQITLLDWVTGAAFIVRREVIEQVGTFDEDFFMYSEELDWQKRIKQAGWQIAYIPQAQIIHYGGKSSEQVVPQRHIRFQTSKIRYFRKHHGRLAEVILRLVILANYTLQLIIEAAKALVGHKRNMRRERVQAYWMVLRSGLRI